MKTWFNSLQGRLTLGILAVVLLSSVVSFVVAFRDWERRVERNQNNDLFTRMATLGQVMASYPVSDPQRLVAGLDNMGMRFSVSALALAEIAGDQTIPQIPLPARRYFESLPPDALHIQHLEDTRSLWQRYWPSQPPLPPPRPEDDQFPGVRPPPGGPRSAVNGYIQPPLGAAGLGPMQQSGEPRPLRIIVSLHLPDGRWLNGQYGYPPGGPEYMLGFLYLSILILVSTTIMVALFVGWTFRPLRNLSHAAERLGRGENVAALASQGTPEIQQLIQTFNVMNDRIKRFVESRIRMLGTMSHDLRTPITIMRLRAELLDEGENRDRILAILEEMQQLTEATVALTKEESNIELTQEVNISSLVESICRDLTEMGMQVEYDIQPNIKMACRPVSLRRAVRNLADNSVKYGDHLAASIKSDGHTVTIIIEDDGPGIPDDKLQEVFLPFVRLEQPDDHNSGGVGLGLSIANLVVESHGGKLRLENRESGGLRAIISLPL